MITARCSESNQKASRGEKCSGPTRTEIGFCVHSPNEEHNSIALVSTHLMKRKSLQTAANCARPKRLVCDLHRLYEGVALRCSDWTSPECQTRSI
jgi:hypothetical protein